MENRKKKKQSRAERKQKDQKNPQTNISTPTLINIEDMQHIIANAIVEADEVKEQKRKEKQEAELKEWREAIGYKDYSHKSWLIRKILSFFNGLICLIKMCFVPKDKIKGDKMAFSFIPLFLSMLFVVLQILTTILSIGFIAFIPLQYILPQFTPMTWHESVFCGFLGAFSFLFSRIFRIASVEIEKSKDRSYLFNLFASFGTIISIVIAIIAIITSN